MKKMILLLFAAFALLGCDKTIDTTQIIGTWVETYEDPNFIQDGFTEYTFNEDGTYYLKIHDALTGIEVNKKFNYSILANVITLDIQIASQSLKVLYTIQRLDKDEMIWQKVGTSYQPGTNGSDYKRFIRK